VNIASFKSHRKRIDMKSKNKVKIRRERERENTRVYIGIINVLRKGEVFCTKLQNTIIYNIGFCVSFQPRCCKYVDMKHTANCT